jgi:hypothetical protein
LLERARELNWTSVDKKDQHGRDCGKNGGDTTRVWTGGADAVLKAIRGNYDPMDIESDASGGCASGGTAFGGGASGGGAFGSGASSGGASGGGAFGSGAFGSGASGGTAFGSGPFGGCAFGGCASGGGAFGGGAFGSGASGGTAFGSGPFGGCASGGGAFGGGAFDGGASGGCASGGTAFGGGAFGSGASGGGAFGSGASSGGASGGCASGGTAFGGGAFGSGASSGGASGGGASGGGAFGGGAFGSGASGGTAFGSDPFDGGAFGGGTSSGCAFGGGASYESDSDSDDFPAEEFKQGVYAEFGFVDDWIVNLINSITQIYGEKGDYPTFNPAVIGSFQVTSDSGGDPDDNSEIATFAHLGDSIFNWLVAHVISKRFIELAEYGEPITFCGRTSNDEKGVAGLSSAIKSRFKSNYLQALFFEYLTLGDTSYPCVGNTSAHQEHQMGTYVEAITWALVEDHEEGDLIDQSRVYPFVYHYIDWCSKLDMDDFWGNTPESMWHREGGRRGGGKRGGGKRGGGKRGGGKRGGGK